MTTQQDSLEFTSIPHRVARPCSPKEIDISRSEASRCSWMARMSPYVVIARPHHWLKNLLVVMGAGLAMLSTSVSAESSFVPLLLLGVTAFCLIASSNYVINEILDASGDRSHPLKCKRPIVASRASLPVAYTQWLVLGVLGIVVAAQLSWSFLAVACLFVALALAYNFPPLRVKDRAYFDVVCEGANSPLRILAGWFIVLPATVPDISLVAGCWAAGSAAMAGKRLQEYRLIGDKQVAAAYRKSFRHYEEKHLQTSMFAYATGATILLGAWGGAIVYSVG